MATNTTLSNLYVERASSEHPLALWMLNEEIDYVTQITNSQRDFWNSNNWDITNGTVADAYNIAGSPRTPILDSSISKVVGSVPSIPTQDIVLISEFDIAQDSLDQDLSNIALGFYVYFDTPLANHVSFGLSYVDSLSNEQENLYTVLVKNTDRLTWKFFSHTFDLPPTTATDIKLVVKVNVNSGGTLSEYNLFLSGLSLGQWSEDFNKYSYGITPENIPSNINLPAEAELKALPAFSYGTSGNQAYYLSRENKLSCKNFGVPLVYGSYNVTKISPNVYNNVNYPSLIFPGYGFLNERGRYNDYTVEMWIKANVWSTTPRKIFGPIASTDGLYVDHAHLSFKINDQISSHFIGEWFRPMMIHIRVLTNFLMVLVNGEEVMSLEIDQDSVTLPEEIVNGKNQDWLGFYAYNDVDPLDIDTFSIYSYGMPTEVAKRHWVWGQAVVAPEQTNSSINAITAFNDYAFANYSVNYNYPDFANWRQAFFSNVEAGSKILSLPEYQLPQFSIGQNTIKDLYSDIKAIDSDEEDPDDVAGIKYLTLKPNEDWDSNSDFIYFDNFAILNDPVETVYGIFKTDGTETNAPLFKITNKFNNDYLLISVTGTTVTYKIVLSEIGTTLATKTIEVNKKFAAGINIEKLSSSQNIDISRFFSNVSGLDVFLAGDGSKKFSGKIYRFGFDGPYNSRKTFSLSDENGILISSNTQSNQLFLHTANYTLTTINEYGLLFPDIAVSGYWEDYMPLSYFSKAIVDYDGTEKYEIDSIQFNLDFPEPPTSQTVEVETAWTYADIKEQYSEPDLLPYETLDNEYYSGWENYEDMSGNTTITEFYNTSESIVRSYVSFQKISDGANKNLIELNPPHAALSSGVLDPENINAVNWKDKPYEVTTGTVIYPPKRTYAGLGINFNDYAIVYHLDFLSNGILHHPVKLRELQLASKVLERTDFTPVGSKFGIPAYYYSRSGLYFDLKGKNPIATYKKSTPHLYLNRQSGWNIKGSFSTTTDRGLSILVNQPKAEDTLIGSVQMWVRFYEKTFPSGPIMIFSIAHKNGIYDFFLESDSSQQRGFVFGVDRGSSEILEGLNYYVNGKEVNTPTLMNEEWTVLSVEFPSLLDFSEVSGKIDINGPLIYNNISYTLATNIEKSESLETRPWDAIENLDSSTATWNYVLNTWKLPATTTWQDVKIINQSQIYNINSQATYERYTGSNRIVIDDESAGLLISPEKFVAYREISWVNNVKIPA
jgi:hypothetical protein